MNHEKLIKKISKYVEHYFEENSDPKLTYHNINHTRYVVKSAIKIALYSQLSGDDLFTVIAAAWFHDIGYLQIKDGHEEVSAQIAKAFLEENMVDNVLIEGIEKCILSTKRTSAPTGLLEQIIMDADTFHLGKKSFLRKSELLRKESELTSGKLINKTEWYMGTSAFIEKHTYYTIYSKTQLDDQKAENLFHLKALSVQYASNSNVTSASILSKSGERAEKSMETAFKIASNNNQRLSSLADNKAHILITVNSIILSAIISLVLRKLQENEYLIVPTFILLSVSLLTMVLAIITTRPILSKGTFSEAELEKKKTNLLFFGNYYNMNAEEYTNGMWMLMDDKVYIYNSIMLDIYYQGATLGRKYRYLRLAYNIFMWGLVVAVIAFFLAAIFHHNNTVKIVG